MSIRSCALACLAAIACWPVHAGSINVRWDAVGGASGYKVYYGQNPGEYTQWVDAGNSTSAVVQGLADCTDWHLAVKAYNVAGESPDFSNEITGWPRPDVSVTNPAARMQGEQFTLEIPGTNFQAGARVEIDNPNVFLTSAAVVSCNQIEVAASIEPTARGVRPAEVGEFTVTVINPDDVFGERDRAFEVKIAPSRFDVDQREGPSQGRMDGRDTIWLSRVFGSREGDNVYQPDSDLNGDGWVDGDDLAYVASNLGRCWNGAAWSVSSCPESLQ